MKIGAGVCHFLRGCRISLPVWSVDLVQDLIQVPRKMRLHLGVSIVTVSRPTLINLNGPSHFPVFELYISSLAPAGNLCNRSDCCRLFRNLLWLVPKENISLRTLAPNTFELSRFRAPEIWFWGGSYGRWYWTKYEESWTEYLWSNNCINCEYSEIWSIGIWDSAINF